MKIFTPLFFILLLAPEINAQHTKRAGRISSENIDSIFQVISHPQTSDSLRVIHLCEVGFYYTLADIEKARPFLERASGLAEEKSLYFGMANAWNIWGIYHDVSGHSDSARTSFEKALAISDTHHFDNLAGRAINNLGMYHWNRGERPEALNYFFRGIGIIRRNGKQNQVLEAISLNNIGLIYQEMKMPEKSLEYLRQALAIHEKRPGNVREEANVLLNTGICYKDLNRHTLAEKYYTKALNLARKQDLRQQYYIALSNLANLYNIEKRYDEATAASLEIINNRESGFIKPTIVLNTYASLASLSISRNNPRKALEYSRTGLMMLRQMPEIEFYAASLYHHYGIALFMTGKIDSGFFFQTKYNDIIFKRFSDSSASAIAALETKFNVASKENEILKLKEKQKDITLMMAYKEIESVKKNIIIVSLFAFFGLSVLAGWLFHKRKLHTLRKEEEALINSAVYKGELTERTRIARDLHDSVGQKLAVIKMFLSNNNTEQAIRLLSETTSEVRSISHNLLPEQLQLGFVKAVSNLIDEINATGQVKITGYLNAPSSTPDDDISIVLYRLLQEIIANIIKHAQADHVTISLSEKEKKLRLSIRDNGTGMDEKQDIGTSKGIGWNNLQARLRLLKGTFEVKSLKSGGTLITLTVPNN